jgi:hypothetical protein
MLSKKILSNLARKFSYQIFRLPKYKALVDREVVVKAVQNQLEREYQFFSENEGLERKECAVIYASGHSGVGKTAFGEQLVYAMKNNARNESFKSLLNKTAYLKIEMNLEGDGFSNTEDGDNLKSPESMLQARLFARACGMQRGVQELRLLIKKDKQDITKFKQEMEKNHLTSMSKIFKKYCEDRILPSLDATLLAMADDFRKNRKLSNEEEVGIFIHIDEHQIFYNDVKKYYNLNEVALNHQKNVFYPLIQLKTNVVDFALKNKIFILPVFTGTSHAVLSDLVNDSPNYGKVHLALNPLSIENAQRLLMENLKKKSSSLNVHATWLTRTNQSFDSIVPMDILTGEVLRMPNHVCRKNLKNILKKLTLSNI